MGKKQKQDSQKIWQVIHLLSVEGKAATTPGDLPVPRSTPACLPDQLGREEKEARLSPVSEQRGTEPASVGVGGPHS